MDIGSSGGGLLLGSGGICPGCCGVVGALHWSWLLLGHCCCWEWLAWVLLLVLLGPCFGLGCCGALLLLGLAWVLPE